MTAKLLYRIAAVILALFAAGHTVGFLSFRPASAEGLAVYQAMNSVQFDFQGTNYSYGGFYRGFGLMITAYALFSASLSWHLATLAVSQPHTLRALGWMFVILQLAVVILCVVYFFVIPAVLSGVVVICLTGAAWLLGVPRA